MNIRIDLNEPKIMQKVTSDRFGLLVSTEWKRLIDPYTPKDMGLLMQSAKLRPWEIEYIQPYSAYQYYGELYVDPVTGAGGFLTSEGWMSRPGVKKVPSGRPLNYQKNNPYSTDHWDEKAEQAGQKEKLYRALNNTWASGNF